MTICFDEQEGNHEAHVHAPGKYINLGWKLLQLSLKRRNPPIDSIHACKYFGYQYATEKSTTLRASSFILYNAATQFHLNIIHSPRRVIRTLKSL